MLKKTALTLTLILLAFACNAQIDQLMVPPYLQLPGDSAQKSQLINSIAGLIRQTIKANKDNEFVIKDELPETSALLDEIKGMENGNGAGKQNVFKCYLTNVVQLDSADYRVQFSYIGVTEPVPTLRASFKLIAKRTGNQILFCSPLKTNTISWKRISAGDFIFYYKASVNVTAVNNYAKKAKEFDKKLGASGYKTHVYLCDDFPSVLQLLGVEYKRDYNGLAHNNLTSAEDSYSLQVVGSRETEPTALDLHDLWHYRLHHAIPVSIINKPVDEGCAYLYGGSWGMKWGEIFNKFKTYMGADKEWLTAFNDNKNFGPNQQYHLYVAYVINALIAQKIEKEKGFKGVIALLSCGKREKSNDNYFAALDKIAGINKANFNETIEKLVEDESIK